MKNPMTYIDGFVNVFLKLHNDSVPNLGALVTLSHHGHGPLVPVIPLGISAGLANAAHHNASQILIVGAILQKLA